MALKVQVLRQLCGTKALFEVLSACAEQSRQRRQDLEAPFEELQKASTLIMTENNSNNSTITTHEDCNAVPSSLDQWLWASGSQETIRLEQASQHNNFVVLRGLLTKMKLKFEHAKKAQKTQQNPKLLDPVSGNETENGTFMLFGQRSARPSDSWIMPEDTSIPRKRASKTPTTKAISTSN